MKVIINGETRETAAKTVKGLLDELSVQPERVAVEVNLLIVRKSEYATFPLNEGDRIEIVNFVGGG